MGALEAVQVCPSSSPNPYQNVGYGMAVQDVLNGPDAPADGNFREWRLSAPATTAISQATIVRDIGNRGTLQSGGFTPYGRVDGTDMPSETCFASPDSFFCRLQGSAAMTGPAASIGWGVRCHGTNFCDGGSSLHRVWVSIRSAIVTIDDPVDPLISEASGELADASAWHAGTKSVSFGGSDVTGIRQVGLYRGTAPVVVKTAAGAAAGGCGQLNQGIAYTFTKPCEGARGVNGPQVLSLNTAALPDGTNVLRRVVRDAAGNEADAELVVKVDNTPPVAPVVAADLEWSAQPGATWTWSGSAEPDRAPVETVEVERCLAAQGCVVEALPADADAYEHLVPEGTSTLRVREIDAAGNVGEWSAPVAVRRDRTAPTVGLEVGDAASAAVTASDALSGVDRTEIEVSVDGGAWRPTSGAESVPAGSRARFRARARDRAGNLREWVESREVLVARSAQPAPSAVATPAPTVAPQPPDMVRTRITNVVVRKARRHLVVSGRVTPRSATGQVAINAGGRRATRRLRGGRFVLRVRVTRRAPRRFALRYLGDPRHAPAAKTVRIRRQVP